MAEDRITGKVVRIFPEKHFGFIRANDRVGDFFFHSEDFNGNWNDLCDLVHPEVTGIVVQSPKGPRISNVTQVWRTEDDPNQAISGLGRLNLDPSYRGQDRSEED